MGLFYISGGEGATSNESASWSDCDIVRYADAGYLSDLTNGRSQTGYCFLFNGTASSWKSSKQTTTAPSSNMAELISLYEATRETLWLRDLRTFIHANSGLPLSNKPITIYEDNAAVIHQIEAGYLPNDRTKHIDAKFFFASEHNGTSLLLRQTPSSENFADIFTKTLGATAHWKGVRQLGLRRKSSLQGETCQGRQHI